MGSLNSKKGLAEKPDTVIESTQIGASQDCWGRGCCFPDPFKGCLQLAISIFDDYCKVNKNGIQIYSEGTKKVVVIDGFRTSVFGNEFKNVFLDPDKIDSEKIAYFINQLIKAYDKNTSHKFSVFNTLYSCIKAYDKDTSDDLSVFNKLCSDKENMKFIARSASAGSLLVLSSFLKNQNAEEKTIFFQGVVAKLFPLANDEQRLELQNNAQKLMEYIAKEVNFVNPPGILFHAGLSKCFDLKLQSLTVGKQGLASEQYFIKMISEYLSGGFELDSSYGYHNDLPEFNNRKNALISSVTDEIVFPFYYVAMFADDLKTYNLGDEKISKFVYKVMQYSDIGKKEGDKLELDGFCHGLIDELELSDDKHKEVSDMAKKYLNIRDGYLALVKKDFFNSATALHETFLKNREQEYRTPHGIARVFDLCVVIFRNELKEYILNDEKISEFVCKVMNHVEIVKKEDGKFELGGFCHGLIKELELSDDQRKEVSDMAEKYLKIRDDYLALQKTYWRDLQKECSINLGGINEQVIKNNNQVEENFFNSVEALYKKLLQNFKQEYSTPPGIFNSFGAFYKALLQNWKQGYTAPPGITRVYNVCVAIFRNELKEYNSNEEQIFKFVDKVMQHGKIVKKTGDTFELNDVCLGFIDELKLSDDQHKVNVSDMVKKHLNIRDDCQDCQKKYWQNCWQNWGQTEHLTNLCEIEEKFFNSFEDLYKTLRPNWKKEYTAPHVIGIDFKSANLGGVEKPSTDVGSVHGLDVLGVSSERE